MTRYPHEDLITENGVTNIPSIFMFDSAKTLFAFLHGCKDRNCVVEFENEKLKIQPNETTAEENLMRLILYMGLKENKNIVGDYLRYMTDCYMYEKYKQSL